jgi:hypothetical protein
MQTEIRKNHWKQWEITTYVPLPEKRELQIFTVKDDSGGTVSSRAIVGVRLPNSFLTKIPDDYYVTFQTKSVPRATQKAVQEVHDVAINIYLPHLMERVREHYGDSYFKREKEFGE